MTVTWRARMVTPAVDLTAPLFRREVELDPGHGAVASAWLHLSSLGVHEAFVDGRPVGEDVLSPGWSAYEWRLRYRSHDVTGMLRERSVLTVSVGNGWWRGRLGFHGGASVYGDRLGLIAQLEVEFADGHRQTVLTDRSWRAGPSDVLADDLYDGQTIDAGRRTDAWTKVGAHPASFFPVEELDFDTATLGPYLGPPVVRQEALRPQRIWTSPTGRTLVDFGQNLVGWTRCRVRGPRGTEIRVRHAEVLEDGELGTRPLRTAQATDRFVLSGGEDAFEPTKTFHGFRYVEVTGWPGDLTDDAIEAVVVHSDLPRTGIFACSDDLLDRLHQNIVWGTRGNVLDLPTDCPQRDERLGWTGDIAVFASTAAFLFDVEGFLGDWLVDLDLEQRHADGVVPVVVPDPLKYQPFPEGLPEPDTTAIWSDAAVWVPWALYQAYGDRALLERQYGSMCAHVRRAEALLSPAGIWDSGFQLGDWLDPDAPPDQPWLAKADKAVVATACLYRTASIMEATAELLGRHGDAAGFRALAARVHRGFRTELVSDDGTIRSDCTTVYTLALVFGLLDGALEELAGSRLAALVAANGYRVSTGFAGTPYVCDALARTGHVDAAYALLTERECPSWLYPVTMGATTVWERWDSMLPDGSINPGEMTSFNHYALGAVADWMHRTVAGVAPAEPGYAAVRFAPRPGGGLTWAAASIDTRHGTVGIRWDVVDGRLQVETRLPDGVPGVLSLPDGTEHPVESGTRTTTW
ncbi:alpha-L-rhamnosidase [Nocardioides guangzhouensis]|uniref:alpha-L-rhamnosidase n=1 Tax=Nocardioides guangzhouensis TaxID=2497878 RepID=A0A4Q4Z820_9ACTN|nr:alpha-L-rhamnosidase [Nocardioides guangzhouensis]RYP84010.1 alpha-L-rhamnosidase [Nocardioides guangzhouensis]